MGNKLLICDCGYATDFEVCPKDKCIERLRLETKRGVSRIVKVTTWNFKLIGLINMARFHLSPNENLDQKAIDEIDKKLKEIHEEMNNDIFDKDAFSS